MTLLDIESGKELAKNQASKTFAWRGMYGASMNIIDVEPAFAEPAGEITKQESGTKSGKREVARKHS